MLKTIQNQMDKIEKAKQKLAKMQDECEHKNLNKEAGCNTGNWCRDDDSYWYDYHCDDCGKRWREHY